MENKPKVFRWTVVILLFTATTINYLDRQVIGLLKPTLEKAFSWTEKDYSYIVMAFTAAYAFGYLIFGRIIDKIGTKIGLSVSIFVWSVAAMGHALASSTFGFAFWRVLLGAGEAGNFPASIKTVAEWFPKKDRALATGIFNAGTNIGAVIAPLFVPWILGVYGWEMAFILTGAVGFVWLIFWWIMYERPERKKGVSQEELAYINSDVEEDDTGESDEGVSWGKLFSLRQTWAYVLGKFFSDPIWWFFLFWIPSYFSDIFDLDLKKPSIHIAVLYVVATIGSVGGGYLSGYFIKKGWPIYKARKATMLIVAFAVMPIMAAKYAPSIWWAVALISLACAAHQAWSANMFTTASDMFPKKAVSSVVGIGGLAGSVGGVLFPWLVGFILDKFELAGNIGAGYNIIFIICGFAYLIAWLCMHFLAPKMTKVKL
ncbi:MFS transporter [Arcticibacterium luteifluviistationis]|uniref:MFS transporter n=1 Tax=Arcticibacterium luteifluviistationis TaxID=1784714 RepID=A0A2Z4G8Y2_9BACT|nr:MFS transporter [Arcticibacterium luteifluviistationis]AWV97709.1 MFS transporter [Arcticibacterium luteifluviistationis]